MMSVRSTVVFMRLAVFFFLAASPSVAFIAALFPAHVVPIVLVGALGVSLPVGVVLVRAMQQGLEEEFAGRYRKLEAVFFLTAAVSQIGWILSISGRGTAGALGLLVSTFGLLAACWLLLKAAPAGQPDADLLAPMDPGRRFD
jgi:hypothetical protein